MGRGLTKAQKNTLKEGEAIRFPTYGLGYIPDYGTRDGSEFEAYESSTTEGWDPEVQLDDFLSLAVAVNFAAVLIY